jgi:hypothetical protein
MHNMFVDGGMYISAGERFRLLVAFSSDLIGGVDINNSAVKQ